MRWLNGILFCGLAMLLSTITAAVYGVLHDQITFSISEEYYTHFKFIQFELAEPRPGPNGGEVVYLLQPRQGAAVVGALATFWLGFPLGLILGLCTVLWSPLGAWWKRFGAALLRLFFIAVTAGTIGAGFGYITVSMGRTGLCFPEGLQNPGAFQVVGYIHNFSYWGAAVGLVYAVIFLLKKRNKLG